MFSFAQCLRSGALRGSIAQRPLHRRVRSVPRLSKKAVATHGLLEAWLYQRIETFLNHRELLANLIVFTPNIPEDSFVLLHFREMRLTFFRGHWHSALPLPIMCAQHLGRNKNGVQYGICIDEDLLRFGPKRGHKPVLERIEIDEDSFLL